MTNVMTEDDEIRPAAYIICATPRSGSTLLCDLLHDTGVAGNPHSFFRREDFAEWADYLNLSVAGWRDGQEFDQPYLQAVLKYGTAGTKVFGMRLMWESVRDLSTRLDAFFPGLPDDSARLQSAFGLPVYVHLSREDKVAQAVSRLKAEQTGLWHVDAAGTERERIKPGQTPSYDARELCEVVTKLEEDDTAWKHWFAQQGVVPVSITYEMLSAEPQATVSLVLSALGQDKSIAETVKPRTAKLADKESSAWVARFRTEGRSPSA